MREEGRCFRRGIERSFVSTVSGKADTDTKRLKVSSNRWWQHREEEEEEEVLNERSVGGEE